MLIKFCILWVEDDDDWFRTSKTILKRFLDGLGFHLEIDRISDPEKTNWNEYFKNTSKYDLMLVDWRVKASGATDKKVGGDVIHQIRNQVSYSDIIFYSGSAGLEKELADKVLQGVYLAKRTDLRDEAKYLIEYLLHKTLHPKIMRGIIVSSLSQIDDLCFKIISKKYHADGCDKSKFAGGFRSSIVDQAERQLKSKKKAAEKNDDKFIASLHSTMILDSHKRALKLLELAKEDSLGADLLDPISALPATVITRNQLAHWKRSEETDTQITMVCEGKQDYIFDQDEASRMRKSINRAAQALSAYYDTLER